MKNQIFVLLVCCVSTVLAVEGPYRAQIDELKVNPSKEHYVRLLNTGVDAFLARVHLIRKATKSIDIQSFIWKSDESSAYLVNELINAANRGVKIKILVDYFGIEKDLKTMAFLSKVSPNLQIKVFNPAGSALVIDSLQTIGTWLTNFNRMNQRMHNKLFLVDDEVGVVGGRNYENLYFDRNIRGKNFKDRDILVIGKEVQNMKSSFAEYWSFPDSVAASRLRDIKNERVKFDELGFKGLQVETYFSEVDVHASDDNYIQNVFNLSLRKVSTLQFFVDAPSKNDDDSLTSGGISTMTLALLVSAAKRKVDIESPYFIMNDSMKEYFVKVRKNRPNLEINVTTNSFGSTDNPAAYAMVYKDKPYYAKDLNVNIFEVMPHPKDADIIIPGFSNLWKLWKEKAPNEPKPFMSLHSKSMVIDDRIGIVGSFNFDPRSAHINTELGVIIRDEAFAKELLLDFELDRKGENAWVVAKNSPETCAAINWLNSRFEKRFSQLPIDLWPYRTFGSYELLPGKTALKTTDPKFFENYKALGSFPTQDCGNDSATRARIIKGLGGHFVDLF